MKEVSYIDKDTIKTQIFVKEQTVNVMRIDGIDFISLTDLARYTILLHLVILSNLENINAELINMGLS